MKAIQSLDSYSDFARKVLEEEKDKKHTKGSYDVRTPRACLARDMLVIYRDIERKRMMRAKWESEQPEQEDENAWLSEDLVDIGGSDNDRDG